MYDNLLTLPCPISQQKRTPGPQFNRDIIFQVDPHKQPFDAV